MKLTLVPYFLICWLLVKFGIVKKTIGNFVAMGLGAVFVLFMLLTFTRYYAFIDLTATTTIKAPHIVLNTPAGGEIDKIYVTHNQKLKAGDPVYSFKTDRYAIQMAAKKAEKGRLQTQLGKLENDLKRLGKLRGEVIPQSEYDAKVAEVETQRDLVTKAEQDMADLQWKIDKALVVAPVDGQVAVQFSSEGQYFGEARPAAIHMFTNKNSSSCAFRIRFISSSNRTPSLSFMSTLTRAKYSGRACIASQNRLARRRGHYSARHRASRSMLSKTAMKLAER
ncbi:MAG: hypothetical protein IPJ38_07120 [Dechloromonas sp.]|uniref:Biotin/lipoyl-binding protein n=1 Tax=Candidatus Dechloromonas phosphorivorans TaxID=2899244 RepID=A0A935MVP4_9RHOO|nr:hypothetical protein [Candidatus Dechloromonas phosphorivorans]